MVSEVIFCASVTWRKAYSKNNIIGVSVCGIVPYGLGDGSDVSVSSDGSDHGVRPSLQ